MLHDILITTKMVKYSLKFKMQLIFFAIILVVGFALFVIDSDYWLAYFYIMLPGLFLVQMYHYLMASDIVKSSPYNYKLQVRVPTVMSAVVMTLFYTIDVLLGVSRYLFRDPADVGFIGFFVLALINFMILLYFGFAYKYFWLAFILLFGTLFPIIFAYQTLDNMESALIQRLASYPAYVPVLCGYIGIILGTLAEYLFLRLFYRKPYAKAAFGAMSKRA